MMTISKELLDDVNRHSNLTPYRHPIMTPLMLSRPGAA